MWDSKAPSVQPSRTNRSEGVKKRDQSTPAVALSVYIGRSDLLAKWEKDAGEFALDRKNPVVDHPVPISLLTCGKDSTVFFGGC